MQRKFNFNLLPLLKFGSVGVINTLVDLAVFTLLSSFDVYAVLAQVISYSSGMMNSYYMNRSWTFRKEKRAPGQALRFTAVNLAALAVTTVLLLILHAYTPLSLFICKLIATLFSVGMNYIGSRYWAFANQSSSIQKTLQE
ncbi:GtrA family protein [Paenibacillus solisilvae]|uniref:GtrA family protein n=1 Tax=Paenibacillus solisilvae TaxID=2486751 RepID=A0ABW0W1I6_9BACL